MEADFCAYITVHMSGTPIKEGAQDGNIHVMQCNKIFFFIHQKSLKMPKAVHRNTIEPPLLIFS